MKKANRRDVLTILFLCLAVACLMTACMNSTGDNQNATASPSAMTSPSPAASATPAAFDWTTKSAEVEERIARISEIGEARVITSGNTALVAVKFAPAYQGDMTARIREMIAGEVVAVTSEDDDVTTVYQLSDRIRAGETIDTLKTDIDEIVRNTTTLT